MLFNPYKKMTNALWEQCQASKLPYLVPQTFRRGFSAYRPSNPTCLLLTPYEQFQPAAQHHQQQHKDPFARMLLLDNPRHAAAVERLFNSGSDYIPYLGIIPSEKPLLDQCLINWQPAIRQYIADYTGNHHNSNQPSNLNLEQLYGELVIQISFKSQSWAIKLEDIEREFELMPYNSGHFNTSG